MADVWSKRRRSENMRRIRSHGNKATELRLVRIFKEHRITGWRRGLLLFGRPDFVFRAKHVCIFVDGCFWHGCPMCYQRPGSHRAYWDAKVLRNQRRDLLVARELRRAGWRVMRIWEHELAEKRRGRLMRRLLSVLRAESPEYSRAT